MFKRALRALASVRLSILLLSLAMVLVYVGTWAQVDTGTYDVQRRYFHSWLAIVPLGVVLPRHADGSMLVPGAMAIPGGYLLGLLMLVNLAASWMVRYRVAWKNVGIHLIHAALVLLLLGEGWTSIAQRDTRLILTQGQTKAYTEDPRRVELAVIDRSPGDHDQVYLISERALLTGATLGESSGLPLTIRIEAFAPNSRLIGPKEEGAAATSRASIGTGAGMGMAATPAASAVEGRADLPSLMLSVIEKGKELGRCLVSTIPPLDEPQQISLDEGRSVWLQLRPKRYAEPAEITLLEFRHDRYPGTDIPRGFSSRVRLVDRARQVDREEVIRMNHPLRYGGATYFQASFSGEDTTVLQVVRNPASPLPYVACAMGALGMCVQFGWGLGTHLKKRKVERAAAARNQTANTSGWRGVAIPVATAILCGVVVASQAARARVNPTDVAAAPVYFDGRLQPIDSVARNALRAMSGKASLSTVDGGKIEPARWMLDLMVRPQDAIAYRMFRIDNGEVLDLLKLDEAAKGRSRFSLDDIEQGLPALREQVVAAMQTPARQRDLVQISVLELWQKLELARRLNEWPALYLLPPARDGGEWRPMASEPDAAADALAGVLASYRDQGLPSLEQVGRQWLAPLESNRAAEIGRMRMEVFYNRFEPFVVAMGFYAMAFLLGCGALLRGRGVLWRGAMVAAMAALLVQSVGMAARMYLQGRPPVTNLYSSAIFIGWGAAILALLIERVHRNGIALTTSSLIATASLIVAQNLAQGGDTMPSMQAVLDSNFWLTTHVLAITYGYSAAFVAGFLGVAFVAMAIFAGEWFDANRRTSLERTIYAVACFAMLFSFIGTLLGGIWADQSWGRFWGWDPKENGAALLVLWLSILLHARFLGVSARGMALLAIGANIVTVWSWFGTNMLGVGMHSYGFMNSALWWILGFVLSQLLVILAGLIWVKPGPAAPLPPMRDTNAPVLERA